MPFKTFNVPSFFAGVATVLAILVVGFGGGVMMSGVLSDTSHRPNKIERQEARDAKPETKPETKPANAPTIPVAPVVAAAAPPANPAPATPDPAPNPAPTVTQTGAAATQPEPQPAAQAQPAARAQPAPRPQTTAQAPAFGPQKPVSLAQPPREQQLDPSQLSRREQARYWRHQRREERRKHSAERRQQEQVRRAEMRSATERVRPPDADDGDRDDEGPPSTMPRERVFGAPPPLRLFGED